MRGAVVALLLAAVVAGGCGGDDETAGDTTPVDDTSTGCRDVGAPEPKAGGGESRPAALLAAGETYRAVVRTSCGDFTVTLDPKAAPKAVASFVALARNDFFDRTVFHRIVPGFVIQAGDPTATGRGGPGYQTVDTPSIGTRYTRGVVAMAKSGVDPRGAAGSQFFVVTAPDTGLPPDYAVIGKVTKGMGVVDRIGILGDPNTELPTQPVVIEDVEIVVR